MKNKLKHSPHHHKPKFPPSFTYFLKETNAKLITLEELHKLGFAVTETFASIFEDGGKSRLMEVVSEDGQEADFSFMYCPSAGYGYVMNEPFSKMAPKAFVGPEPS